MLQSEFHYQVSKMPLQTHLARSRIKHLLARQQAQMYASFYDECHNKREEYRKQ